MRPLPSIVFALFTAAVLPGAAKAGDAEGCLDLKTLPRMEGCVIVECSAKQHDTFEAMDNGGDANINSLAYSCPLGDLEKMKRDFETQLRKAGFQSVSQTKEDQGLMARKNSQWIHWNASSEDGAGVYSLTVATKGTEKFKAETCSQPPMLSSLKQCEVVECTSKGEDSVAMRTGQKEETSLTGNVETLTLQCPSIPPAQAFSTVENQLKESGFEIVFSDREHPESSWLTGRAGKRWVELVNGADAGEAASYILTVVPAAEVLTAPKPEPTPVVVANAISAPAPVSTVAPTQPEPLTPQPLEATTQAVAPPAAPEPAAVTPPVLIPAQKSTGFVPPKPIFEVPIEATHDRIYSVVGDVVITLLVDVNEEGVVTNAVLGGHITKDVLKLEGAAREAIAHWRFEPARQDERVVPAVKIPVQIHFHGRPWRF